MIIFPQVSRLALGYLIGKRFASHKLSSAICETKNNPKMAALEHFSNQIFSAVDSYSYYILHSINY